VTDGSHSFAPALRDVSDRIRAEDRRVAGRPHATVALMIPMTAGTAAGQTQIREEVQGAYLAQYSANHLADGRTPPIYLELANPGQGYGHWQPVARTLAAQAHSDAYHLRAVVGFDTSVAKTGAALAWFGRQRIPVVGGPITADSLANSAAHPAAYPTLARVAPTNGDQAAALSHFDRHIDPATALVVEDTRPGDDYIASLRTTFERLARGAPHEPETYTTWPGSVNAEGDTTNQFHQMVTSICQSPAKVVYFAGRPVQLRQFVNELGDRPCTQKRYTVISGSNASTVAVDPKLDWKALRRGVTVEYASLAHPDEWTGAKGTPTSGGSASAYRALSGLAARAARKPVGPVGPVAMADSRTIIAYDSALTAITAIRSTVKMPSLKAVSDDWARLHGPGRVDGASGWICLDRYGNAYDKAVAVVRLTDRHSVRFMGIAWPAGKPPGQECTAPNVS
jgi:hypothetical protein